ncbi:MAG: hypothetical protein ABFD97_20530 [Syntrophobacter sp.]
MRFKTGGASLGLLPLALLLTLLAGCSMFDFGHKLEFSTTWVSTTGQPSEQLYDDQAECRRDGVMMSPPGLPLSQGTGGDSWGYSDMKAFDSCMRAKGWVKK